MVLDGTGKSVVLLIAQKKNVNMNWMKPQSLICRLGLKFITWRISRIKTNWTTSYLTSTFHVQNTKRKMIKFLNNFSTGLQTKHNRLEL